MIVALFALFFINTLSLSPGNESIQSEVREAVNSDFKPRDIRSKYYSEYWTYHFFLEDSIQIVYSLSINDIGSLKERVGGARMLVYWKDGNEYTMNREYPYKKFYYDESTNDLGLNRGSSYWIKGSLDSAMHVRFKTSKDGVKYDLELKMTNIIKGKIVNNGEHLIDNNQMGINLLIAHSDVTGQVAINNDTVNVTGYGFADHQFHTFKQTDKLSKGIRYHVGNEKKGFVGHIQFQKDLTKEMIGYTLKIEDGETKYVKPIGFYSENPGKIKGAAIDFDYSFYYSDDTASHLRLGKKLLEFSVFDELSRFMQSIVKRIFGAEIVEFISLGESSDYKDHTNIAISGYIVK